MGHQSLSTVLSPGPLSFSSKFSHKTYILGSELNALTLCPDLTAILDMTNLLEKNSIVCEKRTRPAERTQNFSG